MHKFGQPVVSRATERSSRALLTTAVMIIMVKLFAIPVGNLKIADVSVPYDAVSFGAIFVLLLQVANHIIHLWGDMESRPAWNSAEKRLEFIPYGKPAGEMKSLLDANLEKLGDARAVLEKKFEEAKSNEEAFRVAKEHFGSLYDAISEIKLSKLKFETKAAFFSSGGTAWSQLYCQFTH